MSTISVKQQDNGSYNIHTPYNPDFVAAIKGIGSARWNSSARAWNVAGPDIDAARAVMREVYGESDLPDETPRVKIMMTFVDEAWAGRGAVTAFGRTLASASGRDSGARVGEGVCLVKGSIDSGGSMKNWSSVVRKGAVFTLTVPQDIFDRQRADWDGVAEIEVLPSEAGDRKAQLLEEREKLLARLAQVEAELKEAARMDGVSAKILESMRALPRGEALARIDSELARARAGIDKAIAYDDGCALEDARSALATWTEVSDAYGRD